MGVVLTHFGFSALPGGFVGVDIFFVISGFLITRIVLRDLENGTFSIADFYARRARRILPALLACLIATLAAGMVILYPQGLVDLAKSAFASALFAANVYFYATADYFAPAAGDIPLLHLWSLGVEEQFYLLFPAFLIAARRFFWRHLFIAFLALAIASIAAANVVLNFDPPQVFYLLPYRVGEFLIGAMLARWRPSFSMSPVSAEVLATAGVVTLVASMVFLTSATPFPGVAALPPCLGTAFIIMAGERSNGFWIRVLASRPFVFIGGISYSLYLVHWPVVVFGHDLFPQTDPGTFLAVGIALSIALASFSFAFIEQPFRRQTLNPWIRRGAAALGTVIVCALVGGIVTMGGRIGPVDERVAKALSYDPYDQREMFQMGSCFMNPAQQASEFKPDTCLPSTGQPLVLLWGDSGIAHLWWGLRAPLADRGYAVGQMTASACPPLIDVDVPQRPNCKSFNQFALETVLRVKPKLVVLGAVWSTAAPELATLDNTIAKLKAAGIRVMVLGPTPFFLKHAPQILADNIRQGLDIAFTGELLPDLWDRDAAMAAYSKDRAVGYISVLTLMCHEKKCPLSRNDVPLHFDAMHLTREGSDIFGAVLAPVIVAN